MVPTARMLLRAARLGLLALIAMVALPALAAVTIPTPGGWSRAGVDPDARDRVEAWAANAGGRVETVLTTRSDDEYAEILALIDIGGPLPASAVAVEGEAEAEAALRYDAQALFGIEDAPDSQGRVDLGGPHLAVVHAQWERDGERYYLALAPSGRTHAAIVMVLEARSRVLYESAFFRVLPDIGGTAAAVTPFRRGRWVTVAIVFWVLAAAATTFGIARTGLHLGPVAVAVRAAACLAGAGLVVFAIVFGVIGSSIAELAAAGVSQAWMALEVAAGGFISAVLVLAGANIFERSRAPVSSAPSGGAFAPRPISSVMDALQRERPRPPVGVSPPPPSNAPNEVAFRPTPVVGVPILPRIEPPSLPPPPRPEERPRAAAGSLGGPAPAATLGEATVREITQPPPGEAPANLVFASELEEAHPAVPPPPPTAEPGTPQPLTRDHERSGPASLETEQILIDRPRPSDDGAVHRRVFKDDG